MIEIIIEHKGVKYIPLVENGITYKTSIKQMPGELSFSVAKDDILNFTEGDKVTLKIDDKEIFHGIVFEKNHSKDGLIRVKAYDKLRYLANRDCFVYENTKASQIVRNVANRLRLSVGEIDDTGYVIPSRVERDETFFGIIKSALEETKRNTNKQYILFDNLGVLTLKNAESLKTNCVITINNVENYNYKSSIENTYNKVVVVRKDKKSKKDKIVDAKDDDNIDKWGVLQYLDRESDDKVNLQKEADKLLKKYNVKGRTLDLRNVLGDINVRAGSSVLVNLTLGDIVIDEYFMVEYCTHTFKADEHLMDITVRGGVFGDGDE